MSTKLKYVGWQVGITYQSGNTPGLSKQYLHDLLGEMKENGMNFISFMMISTAENDPYHDGYAWPVKNGKLKNYLDKNSSNAVEKTEFLSEIIKEASDLGFHVNLFQNSFHWGNRIKEGYPGLAKTYRDFHHCVDNPVAWEIACDEVKDLFAFYAESQIDSYGFEMVGHWGCRCPDTIKRFNKALTNGELEKYEEIKDIDKLFTLWERLDAVRILNQYTSFIKQTAPGIDIWHHGFCELGDFPGNRFSPASYREAEIDTAIPCIHLLTQESKLKAVIDSAETFPLALHLDTRDTATMNYDIPLKTPEYIYNSGRWIEKYYHDGFKGVVFFYEPATTRKNKNAVYEVVRNWQKTGLL